MTALRILGWWVLGSFVLAGLWAAYRAAVGDIESPAGAEPTCPGCRELARQLADARLTKSHLERANDSFHDANLVLAAKVARLEGRRRGVA